MAFTDAQRLQIRYSLGYPYTYKYANYRLENAIDLIEDGAEGEAQTVALLASIAAVDVHLSPENEDGIWTMDGVKKADEITFKDDGSGNSAENEMRKRGRMYVGRLSILLGVPRAHDIFSEEGYKDDDWAGSASQIGGPLPLG